MRCVNVSVGLPNMTPEDRKAWTTWLERHHIDPHDVLLGRDIICDDEARQVRWTACARDENGEVLTAWNEVVTEEHFVQLEAPALPMPPMPLWGGSRR